MHSSVWKLGALVSVVSVGLAVVVQAQKGMNLTALLGQLTAQATPADGNPADAGTDPFATTSPQFAPGATEADAQAAAAAANRLVATDDDPFNVALDEPAVATNPRGATRPRAGGEPGGDSSALADDPFTISRTDEATAQDAATEFASNERATDSTQNEPEIASFSAGDAGNGAADDAAFEPFMGQAGPAGPPAGAAGAAAAALSEADADFPTADLAVAGEPQRLPPGNGSAALSDDDFSHPPATATRTAARATGPGLFSPGGTADDADAARFESEPAPIQLTQNRAQPSSGAKKTAPRTATASDAFGDDEFPSHGNAAQPAPRSPTKKTPAATRPSGGFTADDALPVGAGPARRSPAFDTEEHDVIPPAVKPRSNSPRPALDPDESIGISHGTPAPRAGRQTPSPLELKQIDDEDQFPHSGTIENRAPANHSPAAAKAPPAAHSPLDDDDTISIDRTAPRHAIPRDIPMRETPIRDTAPRHSGAGPDSRRDPINVDDGDSISIRTPPRSGSSGGMAASSGAAKPQLTIEKVAPPHAVLGQPLIYRIFVRNVGVTAAQHVVVEDVVPPGSKLNGTIPRAELAENRLIWRLGTVEPGEERRISVRVIPMTEGELGSVATVNFSPTGAVQNGAAVGPRLQLSVRAPRDLRLGQEIPLNFRISNVGDADAAAVVLRDILPANLQHPGGNDIEFAVGLLRAGETRDVELITMPVTSGTLQNRAIVYAEGGLTVEKVTDLVIGGSTLTINRGGPERSYINRPTTFTNTVANSGNHTVRGVVIVETIPEGLQFVQASDQGQFDPSRGQVTWRVPGISAGQSATVSVVLTALDRGTFVSNLMAQDESGGQAAGSFKTSSGGIPALAVSVSEMSAPMGIGDQMPYRIQVANRGAEPATNVAFSVVIPRELKLVDLAAPARYRQVADRLEFERMPQLGAGETATFQLTLRAMGAGDLRLQLSHKADHMARPLVREEAVLVVDGPQ